MKNNKPLISIILPNYNSYKFLNKSINSILNQTYKNFELIIIDDCSTDKSLEIIKKFLRKDCRISFYSTKKNSGLVSVPRNLGVTKARGEYIAFLDADDFWNPNKLFYQISKIKNFDFSFVAANYFTTYNKKKSNFIVNYIRISLQILFTLLISRFGFFWLYVYNPFLISSAIIKKKIFIENGFDENLNIREDLNFWLKVFKKKKNNFIYHPKILLTIVRSKKSMSSNKVEEFNKILITISNNFLENKNFDKFKFFLLGILLRTIKMIISKFVIYFYSYLKIIVAFVLISYFTIFYSPLLWFIGNNLIYFNQEKKTEAVFILSGHKGFQYVNQSFMDRFIDIKYWVNKFNANNDVKFFLLGKLRSIPDQKILESLMISEDIDKNNIVVMYNEYQNSYQALELLKQNLEKHKISSITIITSPYHSSRLSSIWKKISKNRYETFFLKNVNQPKKNNFFERSYNKKEIIYELFAIIYYNYFSYKVVKK